MSLDMIAVVPRWLALSPRDLELVTLDGQLARVNMAMRERFV